MRNLSAVGAMRVRCGMAHRSLRRHVFPALTPSARATGRSSVIPMATRGWSRKLPPGSPAASDTAFASTTRRREVFMKEKEGAATAVSRCEGYINSRVGLKLFAAGMAAALLPHPSRAETLGESLPSIHPKRKRKSMSSYIKVGQENSTPIELYYEDHGSGSPVVLIHGWPLNGASWEKQTAALLAAGHRVITYDRRGFGSSSKPALGYNYDTFASDLDVVLSTLNLTDVSLVGFSMGTGEVTRYVGKYGAKRVRKAVLIGTLGPYLVKTADNPEGVDRSVFEGLKAALKADRPALLMEFLRNFYNYDVTGGKLVSERVLEANWNVAAGASAIATLACVDSWIEDFRQDITRNTVPTLILHGDADRILPPDVSSRRQAKMNKNVSFAELKGGPMACCGLMRKKSTPSW